uniref:Endonuclease/exonuclease/phosphatase domain-containing protein n=1 Tax=Takifugu rubripes TaxID=31033 RepID=A0A674PC45_TAKRU
MWCVATLFSPRLDVRVTSTTEIAAGRALAVRAEVQGFVFCLINIYAPSQGSDRLDLFQKKVVAGCNNNEFLFLGGDFNCTENPLLDRNHPEPHLPSKSALTKLVQARELCDVWRYFHPGQSQFTWTHSRGNQLSLARAVLTLLPKKGD